MDFALSTFKTRQIAQLFSWFKTERDCLEWAGANMSWPLKRGEMKALIKQHRGSEPPREIWAVMHGEDMIGHFQLSLNRRLNTIGIGRIALAPHLRGQGHAAAIMSLILKRVFQHGWAHRADLMVYSKNAPAIAAYTGAGFTLEGTRRQTTPFAGEVWDTHMMSILRPEYETFDKRT